MSFSDIINLSEQRFERSGWGTYSYQAIKSFVLNSSKRRKGRIKVGNYLINASVKSDIIMAQTCLYGHFCAWIRVILLASGIDLCVTMQVKAVQVYQVNRKINLIFAQQRTSFMDDTRGLHLLRIFLWM